MQPTIKRRNIVVFLGPTLARVEAQALLDAIYLPPAEQGSVISAFNCFHPETMLIIDGAFQNVPAIRHKEILWAASQGVAVIGAASMGALRAAELYPYVSGVGLIYRWYRRFQFAPDDAVAVIHGPPQFDYAALTIAAVDLLRTLSKIQRQKSISDDQRRLISAAVLRLNFRERTLDRVAMEAALVARNFTVAQWIEVIRNCLVDQKKHDSRQALQLVAQSAPDTLRRQTEFRPTAAFAAEFEQLMHK